MCVCVRDHLPVHDFYFFLLTIYMVVLRARTPAPPKTKQKDYNQMKKHNLYDESVCVCVTARVCVCVLKSSVTRSILASLSLLVDFILSRVDPLSSHIHKDKMYGKFLYFGFPQKRAKRIPFLLFFFFFTMMIYTLYCILGGVDGEREEEL